MIEKKNLTTFILIFGKIVAMEKMLKKMAKAKPVLTNEPRVNFTIKTTPDNLPVIELDKNVLYWLDPSLSNNDRSHSEFDLIAIAHDGITKTSIDSLASHLGITRKNLAENIFDISVKTFERKASHIKLDKKISSHALEIAKVIQHAFEVFQEEDKIKVWINRENRALNNMKPIQLFDTLTGLNLVHDILVRIEEGVYS